MVKLTPGQTVIGVRNARTKTGETIEVKVIYVNEESGLLENEQYQRTPFEGEQYRKILSDYRQKCDDEEKRAARKDDLDSFMQDGKNRQPADEYRERDYGSVQDSEPDFYENEDGGSLIESGPGEDIPKRKHADARHQDAAKLKKKDVKVPLIILIVVFALAAILFIVANIMGINVFGTGENSSTSENTQVTTEVTEDVTTYEGGQVQALDEQDSYIVTVISRDVPVGDILTEDMVEQRQVTAEEYQAATATEYISADGSSHTGTPVGWSAVSSYMGMMLTRSLKEGDVLMREDLTGDVQTITGKTQITLYAVISSDSIDGDVTMELGRYVIEAGTLDDILNSKGISLINGTEEETTEAGK